MKGNWLWQRGIAQFIILNLLIAIAYAYGVRISHDFATLPGTVASVWFPSGMTLALVYLLGDRVILGIIGGSTYALTLGLLKISSLSVFNLVLILIACACGNVLQPMIATYLIKRFSPHKQIFSHVNTVVLYILAAVFSPTISAFLGITSLCITGIIPWTSYGISWMTWWLGSALPHLIFTPTILLWQNLSYKEIWTKSWEIGLGLSIFLGVSWIAFVSGYPLAYLFLPILIWTVFRYGSFFASLLVSIVSLIAILATAKNHGLYIPNEPNASLLLLQSFMAVLALTSLILSAVIDEKKAAQLSLKQAMENLELQVIEKTTELQRSEALLKKANFELEKLVNIDGLTQVGNRRCFDDRLKMEWQRLSRDVQPISLILFDIDYFKLYNDLYGHQMGDACLTAIAQTVKQVLSRPADLVARYGGEEFVIILPNTDIQGALIVAEQIRIAITNLGIVHQSSSISDIVTISLGVASLLPNSKQELATLIKQADTALYRAKQQGRNQSVVFSDSA
ncbi:MULTISPECIES: diguanylate cyclase domain-containing protein [Pseudanabaena]|uniref:sensor domain-containing diguanylate cyclase n=1 Tax=Pseudanabaena TaxID=1152 RepID=UPI0024784B74|nr:MULTISPECIES: diguanylate cyclase [Pseudanabaena]MEA5488720.1 diguanylate cyclase [Pseudanabaena sp. CCNP1317]WGS71207.1 diguanylate cyclase [Pseudanabaena galeata CCNP1313]